MRAATNTLKQTSRKELAIDEQLGIPQDLAPVIRQTIRNGGTYYHEKFLIQKVKT
jgi:hypothetical protein